MEIHIVDTKRGYRHISEAGVRIMCDMDEQGMGPTEIAKIFDCSRDTVRRHLRKQKSNS